MKNAFGLGLFFLFFTLNSQSFVTHILWFGLGIWYNIDSLLLNITKGNDLSETSWFIR